MKPRLSEYTFAIEGDGGATCTNFTTIDPECLNALDTLKVRLDHHRISSTALLRDKMMPAGDCAGVGHRRAEIPYAVRVDAAHVDALKKAGARVLERRDLKQRPTGEAPGLPR